MNFLTVLLPLIVVLAVVLVIVGIVSYNGLVKKRNEVEQAWRQVDVELNRRYELIPNLVETVRGYASYESETLDRVIEKRNQAHRAPSGSQPSREKIDAEAQLTSDVRQVLVTAESYPELKADAGFRQLASQLAETEDRIANGRKYYNALVAKYNTAIQSFPANLFAGSAGFSQAGYFEVDELNVRTSPTVDFGQRPVQDRAVTDDQGRNSADLPQYRQPAGSNQQAQPAPGPGQPELESGQFSQAPGYRASDYGFSAQPETNQQPIDHRDQRN